MTLFEKLLLVLYLLIGILCLFVVGYLEVDFLKTIFTDSLEFCVFCVIVIEAFKSLAIFYHRYSSHKGIYIQHTRISKYLNIGRFTALIFSFIVCITTVSKQLNTPKEIEANLKIQEDTIRTSFNKYLNTLSIEKYKNDTTIDKAKYTKQQASNNAVTKIVSNSKIKENYNQRISALNNFSKGKDELIDLIQRNKQIDSIVFNSQTILQNLIDTAKNRFNNDYKLSENKSVVGVYETYKHTFNSSADFKKFKYVFIILIGILISALLEIIIVNIFNYLSVVYLDNYHKYTDADRSDQYLSG